MRTKKDKQDIVVFTSIVFVTAFLVDCLSDTVSKHKLALETSFLFAAGTAIFFGAVLFFITSDGKSDAD